MSNPRNDEKRKELFTLIHERTGKILFLENANSLAAKAELINPTNEIEFNENGFSELWEDIKYKSATDTVNLLNKQIKAEEDIFFTLLRQLKEAR